MQKYRVEVNDNGSVRWYKHGTDKLHRIDGPAIERANGYRAWYIEGKKLSEKEFLQQTSTCNGKVIEYEGKRYKLQLVEE